MIACFRTVAALVWPAKFTALLWVSLPTEPHASTQPVEKSPWCSGDGPGALAALGFPLSRWLWHSCRPPCALTVWGFLPFPVVEHRA